MKAWQVLGVLFVTTILACSSDEPTTHHESDAATSLDAASDLSADAASDLVSNPDDLGVDAELDLISDAASDAEVDVASDAEVDAASDAEVDATSDAEVDAAMDAQTDTPTVPGICDAIQNGTDQELCTQTANTCEGVFYNSMGCTAFCAQAGLSCGRVFENLEPMCAADPAAFELDCTVNTGNPSDFCLCVDNTCVPSCNGVACGSDGCGGSCGTCAGSQSCQNGFCN